MPDSYGGIEVVVNLAAAWIGMLFLMQCIGWFRGLGKGRKDELGCDPAPRGDPRMHHRVGVCLGCKIASLGTLTIGCVSES